MKGARTRLAAALFAALILPQSGEAVAQEITDAADLPPGWQQQGLQPLAYIRLGPDSARAFKMSMKRVGEHWYLFVANGGRGKGGFEVFDVSDPRRPERVASVAVPDSSGQLTLGGNLLIVAQQIPYAKGAPQESPFMGVASEPRSLATLFDVSDPRNPRKVSTWSAKGWGTHRNVYPGGRYAYMSAWVEGFKGQATLVVLDVSDPANPRPVGQWWQPGQRDGEPARPRPNGYHGPAIASPDGRRLTAAYTPSLVNLDIGDPTRPSLIGKLDFSPLPDVGAQALHTAIPLPGGMVHVNTEPSKPDCDKESLNFAAIVDNKDPATPRLAAFYPRPQPPAGASYDSFCAKGGRLGPHNVNGEIHAPELQAPGPLIYMTYFTAGVRVYDVSNPYEPREVAWFLPEVGPWSSGQRGLEDVIVDKRGYAYVSDGAQKGVWVLRHTGTAPVARP